MTTFLTLVVAYVLWAIVATVLAKNLDEVERKSWHYRLCNLHNRMWQGNDYKPGDSCHYAARLIFAPLTTLLSLLLRLFAAVVLTIACYVAMPILFGEYPSGSLFKFLRFDTHSSFKEILD